MKRIIYLTLLTLLAFSSCEKPNTTYRVDYYFDNTELQSDFLQVNDNVRYRTTPHKIEMVEIDGVMHEFVSGHVEDFVYDTCTELTVDIVGYREVGGIHTLDRAFKINVGTHNQFEITPDMQWLSR